MILFPGDSYNNQVETTFQGGYGAMGGSERFAQIDANVINVNNVTAQTVNAGWVYAGNINATQITAGNIDAARMQTNVLTAVQANVSTLSAITANLGNAVIGGSTDSLGTLVIKNNSGNQISKLNQSGIIIENAQGLFFKSTTSGHYWSMQVNGSNQSIMSIADADQFFMYADDESTNIFSTSKSKGPFTSVGGLGWLVGNGNTGSNPGDSARVIKSGTVSATITADSYKDITISFGYTFTNSPFVVTSVSGTTGTLGGVHEWNCGNDTYSTTGCHVKCRHVNYTNGSGDIYVDWIAIGQKDAV